MVRAIAQLARAMNITTVAEYVETEEIRTRVRALGVDYGQGFAIARPVPVGEVLDVLPVLAAATPGRLPGRRTQPATPAEAGSQPFALGFAPMKLLAVRHGARVPDRSRRRRVRAPRRRARAGRRSRAPREPTPKRPLTRRRNRATRRSHGSRAARIRRRRRSIPNSSTMRCAAWSAGSIPILPISMPRNTPTCASAPPAPTRASASRCRPRIARCASCGRSAIRRPRPPASAAAT